MFGWFGYGGVDSGRGFLHFPICALLLYFDLQLRGLPFPFLLLLWPMVLGFLSILDQEEVLPLTNNGEVGGYIEDQVKVLYVGLNVVLDRLEIFPLLDVDLCNLLVLVEHDIEVDFHLLELRGVGSLQIVVLLLGETGEPEGPDLELEVGRLRVAAVVEGYYFAGVGRLLIDCLQ